jgi:branched-chain amino acid transport system substrate-binding protein
VGRIDRAAIVAELKKRPYETIVGPLDLRTQVVANNWLVGQWQDGEFFGIAPANRPGARTAIVPKPAWK